MTPAPTAQEARPAGASDPNGSRVLLDLCDEEILAVDGPDQGIVTLPYLGRVPPAASETVRSTALRCLFTRGLVRLAPEQRDAMGLEPAAGERTVTLHPDLAWVLAARRVPDALLAAQRLAAGPGGPEVMMRYVFACGRTLLLEDVSESGVHRFVTAPARMLPELMQEFLAAASAPQDIGAAPWVEASPSRGASPSDGGSSWPQEVRPGRDGAGILAGVHVVAELVARTDDAAVAYTHTAYIYPEVAYLGTAPVDDPGDAVLTRAPSERLGAWAAALLPIPAGAPPDRDDPTGDGSARDRPEERS